MATSDVVKINRIDAESMRVPIIGTTPLIVHNFSEKSRRQMLEAQQGKKKLKVTRDPEAEYQAAFYRIFYDATPARTVAGDKHQSVTSKVEAREAYGFPVTAFKQATTTGASFYDRSVTQAGLRRFMFFHGILTKADPQPLVEIFGDPEMREDIVRLGGISRSADLRYRPMFPEWSTTLHITYVKSSIDRDSVLSLIDAGGMGVGVGEWRPECRGEFGTYRIDLDKKVEVISND